ERQQEILDLLDPRVLDGRIVGWPLDAEIFAVVLVGSVLVSLAIRLVVLLLVRHEIVQREAVVRRHTVDAALRRLPGVLIQIGASREPARKEAAHPGIAPPELPHVISIPAVPLRPGPL